MSNSYHHAAKIMASSLLINHLVSFIIHAFLSLKTYAAIPRKLYYNLVAFLS